MSIWNKVLAGLIFLLSLGFFYMGAKTLKVHQYWRELAQKHEAKLSQVEAETVLLKDGGLLDDSTPAGIRRLKLDLHRLMIDRGRVWRDCTPGAVQDNKVSVRIPVAYDKEKDKKAPPLGIADKAVIYVFEETEFEKGGRYIGEFKVTGVSDEEEKAVVLEPTLKWTERESKRFAQSRGPWVLYEQMPADSHRVFAGMSEQQLRQALPEQVVPEYVRDGKKAEQGDPAGRVFDGKYIRPLRDYAVLMEAHFRDLSILDDWISSGERDRDYIQDAGDLAKKVGQSVGEQLAALKQELAKAQQQRDAVTAHGRQVATTLNQVRASLEERFRTGRGLSQEVDRMQREAARQIDERTRTMAQAGGT